MNNIIETQAYDLADLNCDINSLSCHLYLDNFNMPLDMQDLILSEIKKLKEANVGNIAKIIDGCYNR